MNDYDHVYDITDIQVVNALCCVHNLSTFIVRRTLWIRNFSCTKNNMSNKRHINLPNKERIPHAIQMMKLIPTEPVLTSKPLGETNIPEPVLVEIK